MAHAEKRVLQAYEAIKDKLSGEDLAHLDALMVAACQALPAVGDADVRQIADRATREGDRYDCDRAWLERFQAVAVARRTEECARLLELSTQELLLAAGEMTQQELLTVKAVLARQARAIRALRTPK